MITLRGEPDSPLAGIAFGNRFECSVFAKMIDEPASGAFVVEQRVAVELRLRIDVGVDPLAQSNPSGGWFGESDFHEALADRSCELAPRVRTVQVEIVAVQFFVGEPRDDGYCVTVINLAWLYVRYRARRKRRSADDESREAS